MVTIELTDSEALDLFNKTTDQKLKSLLKPKVEGLKLPEPEPDKFQRLDWIFKNGDLSTMDRFVSAQKGYLCSEHNYFTPISEWEKVPQNILEELNPKIQILSHYNADDFTGIRYFDEDRTYSEKQTKILLVSKNFVAIPNFGIPEHIWNAKDTLFALSKSEVPVWFVELENKFYVLNDLINLIQHVGITQTS